MPLKTADLSDFERRVLSVVKDLNDDVPQGLTKEQRDAWKMLNLTRNYGFIVEDEK